MKAISLWRPWIDWVLWQWKTEETRRHDLFAYLVGQTVVLHQAIKWDKAAIEIARPYMTDQERMRTVQNAYRVTRGFLVGAAFFEKGRWFPENPTYDVINFSVAALCDIRGLYSFKLKDITPFKVPIPWKGHQGPFDVPDEVIEEALKA